MNAWKMPKKFKVKRGRVCAHVLLRDKIRDENSQKYQKLSTWCLLNWSGTEQAKSQI